MNEEQGSARWERAFFPALFSSWLCATSLFTFTGNFFLSPLRAAVAAEPQAIVQRVSHMSAADYTRVTITLSDEVQHRLSILPTDREHHRPARIVIDFASSRKGPEAPEAVTIHDGLLQQVRMGQFSSTTTRVVLDVEKVRRYQLFAMYSPYRLIIDVHGEKAQEPPKKDSLSTTAVRVQPQPPSPPPPAPKTQLVVMLDPGHGGKDPGAIGVGNVSEKDVVLAISKRLEQKLSSRLSVKVLFTRSTDVFIPLEERIAQANAAKADLFVSIHANASPNTNLQGVETYYLNNTNDRATIRLASLENGIRPGGNRRVNDLVYLLSDLIQSGKEEESIALAHNLQEAVVARAKEEYAAVQDLGVKKGPFYVLVGAQMPCVLVETAFISHRVEGKHLAAPRYQEALAEGLYLGIARFLRTEPSRKSL